MQENLEFQNSNFINMFARTDWNLLAEASILREVNGLMSCIFFISDAQTLFSHDEAFYYHGLTDREPIVHTLTMYSGYNAHRLVAGGNCKVYTVKRELLNIGRTIVEDNDGNLVPMYDLERTICDLIRSRNSIEVQDFNSVLKTYVSRRDKDLNRLMEYAKLFRVDNVIRRYMGVLL